MPDFETPEEEFADMQHRLGAQLAASVNSDFEVLDGGDLTEDGDLRVYDNVTEHECTVRVQWS